MWALGRWWIHVFMHASLTFLLDMAKAAATVALGIIAPARGPDGVTRREFFCLEEWYLFSHYYCYTSEKDLFADPF